MTPTHTTRPPPALASAARNRSLQNTRINSNDKSWPVSYRPDSWVELRGGSGHLTAIQSPLRPARFPCIDGRDGGVCLHGDAVGGCGFVSCFVVIVSRSYGWNGKFPRSQLPLSFLVLSPHTSGRLVPSTCWRACNCSVNLFSGPLGGKRNCFPTWVPFLAASFPQL